MARTLTMDRLGNFTVSDDPEGALAAALVIATTPQHELLVGAALLPDGRGLQIEGIGTVRRVTAPEELPDPFDQDPSFDPYTQELWRITRESCSAMPLVGHAVVTGRELRDLVARAICLRARR